MANILSFVNGIRTLINTIVSSAGNEDSGKIPHLNTSGKLDGSFIPSTIPTKVELTNNQTDVWFKGLRSNYYVLETDLVIAPVIGGQSGAYSYWGLQLGGIRGSELYPDGTGAGVKVPPVLNNIENPNSFCVGIRTQVNNTGNVTYGLPTNFSVLALYRTAWQTSGNYLDCKNASFASVFKVDISGFCYVNNVKVLGARNTGWTAGTGTELKGAFTTSTATLADVAGRVLSLELALRSHGLIN